MTNITLFFTNYEYCFRKKEARWSLPPHLPYYRTVGNYQGRGSAVLLLIFFSSFFLLVQFKNEFILLFFCVLAGTTLFKLHNSCYAITQLMNYWYCVLNLKYLVLYFWEMMELTVKSCSQVKNFNSIKLYNFYLTNFLHLIPFRKKWYSILWNKKIFPIKLLAILEL